MYSDWEFHMQAAIQHPVWVRGIRIEADGVRSFELCPATGSLPPATPGAHIDVHLPNELVRQYSLIAGSDSTRYVIGVNRDANSRGGSRCLHEQLQVGAQLTISVPRNHFALHENAAHSVLIAGGIGITPLYAMAARLTELGRAWTLYYCVRTRQRAAFLDALEALARQGNGRLQLICDQEPGQAALDLAEVVARHDGADTHFYCCGPAPMIAAYEQACAALPAERVHLEYFSAAPQATGADAAAEHGFRVRLARSGQSVEIPPGRSILEVLLERGMPIFNSCREGMCGSCETAVLDGQPEHRDRVLSAAERAAGNTMMICVSRCRGEELTLDL